LFHIFKNKVEVIVDSDDFLQFHNLRVVQLAQGLYLSECHALFPRVKLLLHFLDGYLFLVLNVDAFDNGTVCSISECFKNFVPFHYLIIQIISNY
jgi:hypothetical protein